MIRLMSLLDVRRVATMASLAGLVAAGGLRLTAETSRSRVDQPFPAVGRRIAPAVASGRTTVAAHRAFVQEYCLDCHDNASKEAGLSLEAIVGGDVAAHAVQWEKVVRKLRARQMPPAGEPRPDEATYDAVVAALEASLDRAAAARPNPGRTDTFRRLNRTEYQNAIRDLLALDVDVAALLPADESSHGFDNVTVGDLSPTLLERYIVGGAEDQPAGGRAAEPRARRRHDPRSRRTSRRKSTSRACRSARAAARRSRTRSRRTASTRSRSGWRATATSTSRA